MDSEQRKLFERAAGFAVENMNVGVRFVAVILLLLLSAYIIFGMAKSLHNNNGHVNLHEMAWRILKLGLLVSLGMTVILS